MVSEHFENNFVMFHICFEIVILVIAQQPNLLVLFPVVQLLQ